MEDDVLVEYVFTQLEDRDINPKKIQINLAGFLNAKRAREFMGELWQMFVEAQNSPEGIPSSLVEKKVMELKIASASKPVEQTYAKATEVDWQHRYNSLTGGRYGKLDPGSYEVDYKREEPYGQRSQERDERDEREPSARHRDPDDDRIARAERRMRHEERRFKERKDLLREKQRNEEREVRRRRPSHSSEECSPVLVTKRFVETVEYSTKKRHDRKRGRNGDEGYRKESKKSRKRHSSAESNSGDDEDRRKKKTKRHHKKDKKTKKHKN
ncbi:PWI domain-containing protein [Meloidogyne graminicola]|uniref:PWI domain-containing protein n=1 Tax=Meloidogyne graminicola TaxID=189291 RepID=A0A8S9ZTF4_9BILA|nr:PWI domain-containing protein [Meloidogyne graminicola]